ncbi:MAG: hypothetical protein ABIO35_05720 [Nitrobacter sp.]
MGDQFSRSARLMGVLAALAVLLAALAYGVTLGLGFASLASPEQPIGNPYFTILEVLILVLAPAMVVLMVAVHAWAPREYRALGLVAVCMMVMLATETTSVHFMILTLSHHPGFDSQAGGNRVLTFKWPSVVYALDILGWDGFFALSMAFAAPVFSGGGIRRAIRFGMIVSAALALFGLTGVSTGNMMLRDVGIAGYLGAFLVVDALLLILFLRTNISAESSAATGAVRC